VSYQITPSLSSYLARHFAANCSKYQVVITGPFGHVTSAVVTVTVLPPRFIAMNVPVTAGNNVLLGFSLLEMTKIARILHSF